MRVFSFPKTLLQFFLEKGRESEYEYVYMSAVLMESTGGCEVSRGRDKAVVSCPSEC